MFRIFIIMTTVESKEELQKILNDFWLLDSKEYHTIRDMIELHINEVDEALKSNPDDVDEKSTRHELTVIWEKLNYIISNGLYKK